MSSNTYISWATAHKDKPVSSPCVQAKPLKGLVQLDVQKRAALEASEASNRRTPMPKFVIERQYLVPMYQHIAVEAESLEEACKKGISDDVDWDTQEMDCDGARRTTLTSVKLVPDGYDADPKTELIVAANKEDPSALDMLSFATFLYENEAETGPLLKIPEQFTDDE
jgi:hypothetical protein